MIIATRLLVIACDRIMLIITPALYVLTTSHKNIHIYKIILWCQGFGQKFFFRLGRSMRFVELEFSVE